MKKIVALVSLLLIATAAAAQYKQKAKPGAKAATPQAVPATGEFRRITREEAYKLYQSGGAIFVDVRSHQSFTNQHIRGAVNIPGSQIISRFAEVQNPDKLIITYCACDAEQSSGKAVLNLNAHGVKNVAALKGGLNEWKAARLPLAAGPK
jgi:rhodanese-related sulfurtransferase